MLDLAKSTKKSLENLAQLLNIQINYGWITNLSDLLQIDRDLISTWIRRGTIPKKQRARIAEMGYPEEQWYISPEDYEASLGGSFTSEPQGLYGNDRFTQEECDMVAAIRELDTLSRQGIYLTVMNELNEALREKKVKSEERKKRILEKAFKTLSKAVGEYA